MAERIISTRANSTLPVSAAFVWLGILIVLTMSDQLTRMWLA